MRRRWLRPVLVVGLAAGLLGGAGLALGPHGPDPADDPAATTSPGAGPPGQGGSASTDELNALVSRTEARLATLPGDWPGWARLGMARLELARITADPAHYALAETAFRRSLTVRPQDNAAALTGLGALAAARHDFRTAHRYARRATGADRWSAEAYGVLTDACVELGRYPEARAAARRMAALRPGTGSLARLSYLAELGGDPERATALMRRALGLALSPGEITFALTHLGDLAFAGGDLTAAGGFYAQGLAHDPALPALLAGRARVEAARGDFPAAITDLRRATAVLPTVDHLEALSDVLTAAGRTAEAATTDAFIRAGAGLSPTADLDLVLFRADHGQAAEAVDQGRALLAGRPSAPVETAYAWALHAAGRDREALTHADRGLRLGTRDARAHYYRGMIRGALGDTAGARADLSRALTLNPYFSLRYAPAARAELTRLKAA